MRIFGYCGLVQTHPLRSRPDPADAALVAATFKALSDPTRARMVLALAEGEMAVGDLVLLTEAPQSTVSRHLANLRAARLVAARRHGSNVYYSVTSSHVVDMVLQAFSYAEHERLGLPDHARSGSRPPSMH